MTNRTLIGDFGGGDYRIRVSKPGFDVTAALDPERMAFDSAWKDGAVVYKTGTINIGSGSGTVAFGETLPEIPFMYYWRKVSASLFWAGGYWTQNDAYRGYFAQVTETGASFFSGIDGDGTFGYLILRSIPNG